MAKVYNLILNHQTFDYCIIMFSDKNDYIYLYTFDTVTSLLYESV